MATTIPTATYWVEAACPRCGAIEVVAVHLHALLTIPDDDAPSIRVRSKSKPVDHSCGQSSIAVSAFTDQELGS